MPENDQHRPLKDRLILGRAGRVVAVEVCECEECQADQDGDSDGQR